MPMLYVATQARVRTHVSALKGRGMGPNLWAQGSAADLGFRMYGFRVSAMHGSIFILILVCLRIEFWRALILISALEA